MKPYEFQIIEFQTSSNKYGSKKGRDNKRRHGGRCQDKPNTTNIEFGGYVYCEPHCRNTGRSRQLLG